MKKKNILLMILIIIVLAAAVMAGIMFYNNSDAVKLKRQLDLGQRYLSELNYEEAVVAFNQAIETDPRSADAYLGLAEAYIGLGDEEAALAALERGYEATGDERLKERIDEIMQNREAEIVSESFGTETDNRIDSTRIEEITTLVWECVSVVGMGETHLLTYDQIETAYRPMAQELEEWIANQETESVKSAVYGDAWFALSEIYIHLGEMERCLEIRRKGYEMTKWDFLKPETTISGESTKDEYGRTIEAGGSITYGEANREIIVVWEDGPTCQIEYDSLGRLAKSVQTWEDGSYYIQEYEYEGDYTVLITARSEGNPPAHATLYYDEYGRILNEVEWSYD